jgi:ribosomal protein S18 acetylase RimI-like enzyme
MTMDFIKPQHHHLQQVMEWVKDPKVFDIWAGPGFRFPFTTESFIEDLKLDELHSRILVDNHQVQAFGQVYQRLNHTHLGRLVVNPQSEGKGIGTNLIKQLMAIGDQRFESKGYSLFVLESNIRAKSLYEHLGFKSAEYPEIMPLAECLYMVKYHD